MSSEIYKAISESNMNCMTYMLTLISGSEAGEKALFSEGKLIYTESESRFFEENAGILRDEIRPGIISFSGQEIYCELIGSDKEIVICGGGHVSMPIISIGQMIGCTITCIDDRPRFADDARRQGADNVICDSFEHALEEIKGSEDTYFVIVTRGHRYDKECLRSIAQKKHAYIGMIGSRRRVKMVKDSLEQEGISREILDSVYTPIGLDIGAETPEEIAVAIMAEIIEVKNRKKRNFGIPKDILKELLSDDREPAVLATIISRKGSAPRGVGSKMLIHKDGSILGTIGGGCMESDVILRGRRMLLTESTGMDIAEVDMTLSDDAENDGMVCGGIIKVLMEVV